LVYYSTLITALFDKKSGTQDNRKFLDIIAMASLFTALVANWGIILIAYNFSIDIDLVTKALFGVLFILIGNYLGQLDINSVMGVRNKWTLSGMGVWKPVHRFSGYIMFISGIMLMLSAFVKAANGIAVVVLLLLIDFIVINIYSYNKYKKVVKKA
ncbi:MAG: SdpI family protein, partial [Clostridiaceae bacterium]|nr:SdpI family protein [Clostridiaceae bacterium]